MAYKLSMADINVPSNKYNLSLEDINIPEETASENLQRKANEETTPNSSLGRTPQIQEEFSNPTSQPGFENLSQQEKLKRISLSQYDPANQSNTGEMVPPGTYESNTARMTGSILPTLVAPELSLGKGLISKYALNPALNSLSRIGSGTAANIAYQLPEIKNKQDLKDIASQSAGLNALLEGGTMPFRAIRNTAQLFNPLDYTASKANQIKNEATATKSVMDKMYQPLNEKYNDVNMTATPKEYLKELGIERSDLFPDAKIIYDNIIEKPNYRNLQNLQSKLGEDWARISQTPAMSEKAQLFSQMRNSLVGKVRDFLSKNKEDLNQYDLAAQYGKNVHYPYTATPTLRKIAKGKLNVPPNVLANSIQKGVDKTVGKEYRNVIPENHPLRNHLHDLNNRINLGKAAQVAIPTITGGVLGELLHPGMGGVLGGLGSGLGVSTAGSLASKFGAPGATGFIQNPLVENLFRKYLTPAWYGAGRSAIGYSHNKDGK